MSKINPFIYVDAISFSKKDLMRNTDDDISAEKGYIPFLTNRALSYHADTIAYANEMNLRGHIDNRSQNDFYINTIRPRKRFAKWSKISTSLDLESVMTYFGYSRSKAETALKILSPESIIMIHNSLVRGGTNNDKRSPNKGPDRDSS